MPNGQLQVPCTCKHGLQGKRTDTTDGFGRVIQEGQPACDHPPIPGETASSSLLTPPGNPPGKKMRDEDYPYFGKNK